MPLEYADFARYYEGQNLSDEQSRAHFSAFADLMECIARVFWREDSGANELGIMLDGDSTPPQGDVESAHPLQILFNEAASFEAPGKKDS